MSEAPSATIEQLIDEAVTVTAGYWQDAEESLRPRTWPATPVGPGVPTLAPGVYRPMTPMLAARFARFGRWTTATHGHWLSLGDMEALWSDEATAADPWLGDIRESFRAAADGWPNEASTLFRPERLSLFAGSELDYQRLYLLWLEFEDEPEVWVYDANGESRYRDLAAYLQAYVTEDMSAVGASWRA